MAKEKVLTIEEKLDAAMVPVDEQPYVVPENWCWTRLEHVTSHIADGSHNPPPNTGAGVPLLSATNIHDRIVDFNIASRWITYEQWLVENERTSIEPGVVLLTIVATIGRVAVVTTKEKFALQRSVAAIKPKIDPLYLSYFLESPFVQVFMNTNSKGTAQKGFYLNSLAHLCCAIAPFAEQHRIVERIETIFAKLDEAKEKAQAVIDGYEDRRAAILHRAFAGELTEKWRRDHDIPQGTWHVASFEDVAEVKSNLVDPAIYMDYPHIAPDNIEKKTGRLLDYHTIAEDGVTSGKHLFFAGQILYSKIRPYLSKVVVVDFDGLCSADMYPVESKDDVDTKYLWYYMLSDDFLEQASSAGSRSVLPKINQKELSRIKVRITALPEQQEIVRILEILLSKEAAVKEAAETTIAAIDTMKQSILARAFRGELGTNDPEDEPAGELLKRILMSESVS